MRQQDHSPAEVLPALALMALRAEMEALATVMPGFWQTPQDMPQTVTDAEVEARFDNLPV